MPKEYTLELSVPPVLDRTTGASSWPTLKRVEEEADPLILALVRQVYDDEWLKPFVTMFET